MAQKFGHRTSWPSHVTPAMVVWQTELPVQAAVLPSPQSFEMLHDFHCGLGAPTSGGRIT
ncbi:MAG TPA: hypothetical protein VFC23_14625 [Thermoanaerobaculia bacterium]|nr:hypothetical protein [Thermoanaerobaculia bacterium]